MTPSRPSSTQRRPRVLVGLGETAGYCALLADGLRAAGAVADHVNLGDDPMRYTDDPGPRLVRAVRWLGRRRRSGRGPGAMWVLLHRLAMAWLFLDAVRRYDAFILRAGDSFFALRDLPLLRRLGKTVVVVFFGSDSRPSYLNGAEIMTGQDGAALAATTAAKRRMVGRIERHASHVVCHPMSAQLHRRRAIAFLELGIPRRDAGLRPEPAERGGPIRFLHAPSRPRDKGTEPIRAAVGAVRGEGVDVELRVVTGRPNAEILDAIADCDVVIDQLYSDTPMAALAAEAAMLGRPALVGGYGWEQLRAMATPDSLPPSQRCHPDDLADNVRRLAGDPPERHELGRRARRFVEERWSSRSVAERYLAVLEGTAPAAWWFDPADISYVLGAGASESTVRASVRAVLEAGGPDALQLHDKPHLVEMILAFVDAEVPA